jgi:magnesium-transporting ATPase (P-type)
MSVTDAASSPGPTADAADDPQWHTVPPDAVASRLATDRRGLTTDEAQARRESYGPNRLEEAPPPSALAVLLHQFTSPLIYVLLAAAVVTLLLQEYIDSGVIAAVLILNAIIGFTQERRAERSVRALMQLVAPRAHVVRDGREQEIDSVDLVPGDIIVLESGARVSADVRLFATTSLEVDESLLTGESLPVSKHAEALPNPDLPLADRLNMAYMGTIVASGRGRGYVVATASKTALGAIALSMRTEATVETPLQQRMTRFAHVVAIAVGVSASVAFAGGVLLLGAGAGDMFMVAVALAVASVPEGLPVVFTITLALSVRRMARRNAIIRKLPAVETLGSTTVIGSDKTGTLTENRMTVREIWSGGRLFVLGGEMVEGVDATRADADAMSSHPPLQRTLLAGVMTNEAHVRPSNGDFEISGDPTEAALLVSAYRLGLDAGAAREAHVKFEIPFESQRQYSASVRATDEGTVLFVKGAPERVLEMCGRMLVDDRTAPLDHQAVHRAAHAMAARGLRVLAMAEQQDPPLDARDNSPEVAGDLTFVGLQGMLDPPRTGVLEAIRGCQDAGVRVLMVTGDHAETARAIGRALEIATDDEVLTGADLAVMDDDTLAGRIGTVSIYARVAPEQKLRIVKALRLRGEVVAMTGDGVNDAPALKAADIGVAMGRSGTDVAREASDMVLADDNFISIYAAVEEGRVAFDNVRKVTFFLISTGAASIVMILTALGMGWALPMLPAQLLWLNLVTNGLQDVALAFEPGEREILERPPRRRQEGILSSLLWERTLVTGIVMAIGTLYIFQWEMERTSDDLMRAQTAALTTMVLFQMFHVGNCRSEFLSIVQKSPWSNPFLFIATTAALVIHISALHFGPTQFILRVVPLDGDAWQRIIPVAASIIAVVEVHKFLRRGSRPTARTRR